MHYRHHIVQQFFSEILILLTLMKSGDSKKGLVKNSNGVKFIINLDANTAVVQLTLQQNRNFTLMF